MLDRVRQALRDRRWVHRGEDSVGEAMVHQEGEEDLVQVPVQVQEDLRHKVIPREERSWEAEAVHLQ